MHLPTASEALYFDNAPVAHIVAFQDRQRVVRAQRLARERLR